MNFSKTTEYALRILSYMSLNEVKLYSAELLYDQLHIPKKYLQRMLTDLVRGGFIRSIRGRNGGFTFARDVYSIFLAEIINFTEGVDWAPKCIFGFKECVLENPCAIHNLWTENHIAQTNMLLTTSLGNLKQQPKME
jgi:Rrf2 family transcriptional regulator, iron-sulfur cluster assembly transcription factor